MTDESTPAPICTRCKQRYVLDISGSGFMGVFIPAQNRKCQDSECPNHPNREN